MAQQAQLDFGLVITNPDAYRQLSQHRDRRCLSCSSMFPSHGPGNRVCDKCKTTESWKLGTAEFRIAGGRARK